MINKNIISLLLSLSLISCAANKKTSEVAANSVETKKESVQEAPSKEEVKIFSVPAAEVAKSESQPQVIYFDTNSSALTAESNSTLKEKVLPEAQNLKTKKVVIEAHCDERGSKAYNKKLSERRALAVKKYLVENGVKSVKIKTVGYGESKPAALGHDEESWAKNRRAVTISIKK